MGGAKYRRTNFKDGKENNFQTTGRQKNKKVKILILVLSYNSPPFDLLMKTQQQTFDSIDNVETQTIYYYGGLNNGKEFEINLLPPIIENNSFELCLNCTDKYYYMSEKFKRALQFISDWDYDLIFRTNSSSYVSKKKLVEVAATLPTEKLYCGWTMEDSNFDGGAVCSGAGFFLSRDCAEILRNQIDPTEEREEDILCGRALRKNGIVAIDDKSRFDYPQGLVNSRSIHDAYHIRFKTGNRLQDAENMKSVHQQIIKQ